MKTALVTGACINTGAAIVEKFLSEGYSVIFTGRSPEKVKSAETEYKKKFPEAAVIGYCINSLKDERTVDEEAVEKLFAFMDGKKMLAETVVLNAADQGLEMEIFKNPKNVGEVENYNAIGTVGNATCGIHNLIIFF